MILEKQLVVLEGFTVEFVAFWWWLIPRYHRHFVGKYIYMYVSIVVPIEYTVSLVSMKRMDNDDIGGYNSCSDYNPKMVVTLRIKKHHIRNCRGIPIFS